MISLTPVSKNAIKPYNEADQTINRPINYVNIAQSGTERDQMPIDMPQAELNQSQFSIESNLEHPDHTSFASTRHCRKCQKGEWETPKLRGIDITKKVTELHEKSYQKMFPFEKAQYH